MANDWRKKKKIVQETPKQKPLIPQKDTNNLHYISFSFRYFKEYRYFGVGNQDASWFANLYDRLKDISGKTGALIDNKKEREDYRLHPIDWNATSCPISIDDLDLPKNIVDNAKEDFIWQFQISKGTGRVVGFFNEDYSIFYIVLLDPKHNLQPSKDFGYAVDETQCALTEYEKIQMALHELETKRKKCKHTEQCPISDLERYLNTGEFYVRIEPELAAEFIKQIKNGTFIDAFNDFLLNSLD
ncbi:MAG: hypothetical protein K2J58_06215 [Muribaculaceae bacterium]|nr:hypothetical protein [Muribaculaceae bacterium]